MQGLVLAIILFVVTVAGYEMAGAGHKIANDNSTVAMQYADAALADARSQVTADLAATVEANGPAGPFTDPSPSPTTPACANDTLGNCAYNEQISVHYTGYLDSGGQPNDTAQNLNRVAGVDEAPIYARATAVVTDLKGHVVATDTIDLTYRAMTFPPYVVQTGVNAASSRADLQGPRDLGGCDPANPTTTCANTANANSLQRSYEYNYLRCQDTGNPNIGLCGPATPRPNNDYQTVDTSNSAVGAP